MTKNIYADRGTEGAELKISHGVHRVNSKP